MTQTLKATLQAANTPEARFLLRGAALKEQRGGHPTSAIVDGQIVFTYPDGTQTCGGKIIKAAQ